MPFVFSQDGKQRLIDASQMRDGQARRLGCMESLSSCCCILPVRKSRDITDPARKDAAAKHLAKHEATKPKTLMKGFYPALKHKRVKFYINRNQPVESRRIALLLNSQIK